MKILYISSLCSQKKFDSIFKHATQKPGQQVQKYHRLIVEGLAHHTEDNITTLSALPISRRTSKQLVFLLENESINTIQHVYIPFVNIPIIRHLCLWVYAFLYSFLWCFKNRQGVVICDVLNITVSSAGLLAARMTGVKNIGIVTDIPGYMVENNTSSVNFLTRHLRTIIAKINLVVVSCFGYYVFLTKQMNDLLCKDHRPFVVIEGQVDVNMVESNNLLENKHDKRVCLYAGSLHREYGIQLLVEGFLQAEIPNAELHIYGDGNFRDELIALCSGRDRIKYFGIVPNDLVVREQLRATVLINPRPSCEEFTKYSFPSKNMEYLVSGTPMIGTALPGMPLEYLEYFFIMKDETVDGMKRILTEVLERTPENLHAVGLRAKDFVLMRKSNIMQTKKIVDMINIEA